MTPYDIFLQSVLSKCFGWQMVLYGKKVRVMVSGKSETKHNQIETDVLGVGRQPVVNDRRKKREEKGNTHFVKADQACQAKVSRVSRNRAERMDAQLCTAPTKELVGSATMGQDSAVSQAQM